MKNKSSPIGPPTPARQHEETGESQAPINISLPQRKANQEPTQDKRPQADPDNLELEFEPDLNKPAAAVTSPLSAAEPSPWRQEITERVQSFRQRRARMRNEPGQEEEGFDFELDRRETNAPLELGLERTLEFPQNAVNIDAEIAPPEELGNEGGFPVAETRERGEEGLEILESAPRGAEEIAIEPESQAGSRLEIVVESPEAGPSAAASQWEPEQLTVAPLSRRFLAGLVDGLVLLIAGGIFTFIFRRAGGHLTPVPPNLAIVAFIAMVFVWSYFGLFTALTYSTPGQVYMGIEVRNLEGWPPKPRESLIRAFGYLVSMSALMIGFFWALVDSDGLTWHDRISGTFLTPVKEAAAAEGGELKA